VAKEKCKRYLRVYFINKLSLSIDGFYCQLLTKRRIASNVRDAQLLSRCCAVCSLRWHNLYPAKSPLSQAIHSSSAVTWAVTTENALIPRQMFRRASSTAKERTEHLLLRLLNEQVFPDAIWNLSTLGSQSARPPPSHLSWRPAARLFVGIYSADAVLQETTTPPNCFYQALAAALKYQRTTTPRRRRPGAGYVATATDEQKFTQPLATDALRSAASAATMRQGGTESRPPDIVHRQRASVQRTIHTYCSHC